MADIITPDRAQRGGGPGMSYWLGTKVVNQPLAMEAGLAARLQAAIKERAFDADLSQLAIGASRYAGQKAGQSGYRVTDDGIAIVPIHGVLIDRGEWLGDRDGWATSYEGIAEQCRRITKDDAIKAVILDIDSGGGMCAGLFDCAEQLIALRASKKVVAVAANMAASAAYALGCTADEFYVTRLGMAGSIGVITLHMSYADMMSQMGVEPTIIHSGAHKPNGNPYQALSHFARSEMAASCDQIYEDFVAHVARERGLDPAVIRATEARCYTGDRAVAAKLVDGVKPFDDVLAHVRAGFAKGGRPRGSTKAKGSPPAAPTTTSTSNSRGARPMTGSTSGDRPDYDAIISASLATIAANGRPAAAAAAPVAAAPAPAAIDAKVRIRGIIGCAAAKDRPALAQKLALETDVDQATAEAILSAAAPEAAVPAAGLANALEMQMAKTSNSGGIKPDAAAGTDGASKSAHRPPLATVLASRFAVGRNTKKKD